MYAHDYITHFKVQLCVVFLPLTVFPLKGRGVVSEEFLDRELSYRTTLKLDRAEDLLFGINILYQ